MVLIPPRFSSLAAFAQGAAQIVAVAPLVAIASWQVAPEP
jgi:hypothetical protein